MSNDSLGMFKAVALGGVFALLLFDTGTEDGREAICLVFCLRVCSIPQLSLLCVRFCLF